jgi:hypothetical protein
LQRMSWTIPFVRFLIGWLGKHITRLKACRAPP